MATINEIKQMAAAVKNATQVGENTAERVGGAISGLSEIAEHHETEIDKKFDKDSIKQESGDAEDKVMSQKATTNAITDETKRAKAAEEAIIFDVSVHNNGAVFESLQALLSSSNLNTLIPASVRRGGITIRFIQGSEQSSDNKYVQFRCMAQNFTTDVTQWQGVDDEPTAGSNNLVESGGTKNAITSSAMKIKYADYVLQDTFIPLPKNCFHYGSLQGGGTGAPSSVQNCAYSDFIRVVPQSKMTFSINRTLTKYVKIRVQARYSKNFDKFTDWELIYPGYDIPNNSITIPSWASYISVGFIVYNSSDNTEYNDALDNYTEDLLSIKCNCAFSLSNVRNLGYSSNNYLLGDDTNFVQEKFVGYVAGHNYKLFFVNPNFDTSGDTITTGHIRFKIQAVYNGGYSEDLVLVSNLATVGNYYEFRINEKEGYVFSHLNIGLRATKGERVDFCIEDISDLEFLYDISISWITENKVLLSDGTNSTNLINGYVSDRIDIPNGVKTILFKNVYIETDIWNSTCPVVAFNSSGRVVGYVNFKSQSTKYDLTYQLPNNTAYIKVSSGAYPDRYGLLPSLYFLSDSVEILQDAVQKQLNYPLSKEMDNMVAQLVRTPRYNNLLQNNTQFVISFFSDIHYDMKNLLRYIAFNKKHSSKIDIQLCGGDMIDSFWSDTNYSFDKWINTDGAKDIILTLGNHDTGENSYVFPSSNKVDVYNRIYAPLIANWGVVQPSNAETDGLMYFYKDNSAKGIRLIVLDCMYWTNDENTWLQNVLNDAKTIGYSVVISTHYQPDVINAFDCKAFNSLQENNPITFLNIDAATTVHNFISDGGSFICWLAGHTHKDYVGTLNTYPEQICLVVSCASCAFDQCLYCDSERVVNTHSQDAFDVIAIDRCNQIIKVLRVGDNMDSWMRSRKTLTIDYINKTVINVE